VKIISTLHTAYIVGMSGLYVYSVWQGSFEWLFITPACYALHGAVVVLLVGIVIGLGVSHVRKPILVPRLQLLWWFPQLFFVVLVRTDMNGMMEGFRSIYDFPMGVQSTFQLGWTLQENEILFVRLSLIALIGISLAAFVWWRGKRRQDMQQAILASVSGEQPK